MPTLDYKKKEKKLKLITKDKKPRRRAKSIYVGVEVEFYAPDINMAKIEELLILHNLTGYVTLKQDGSIHPPTMSCDDCPVRECEQDELCCYKPAEITILASEQKFKRIMERVDNVFKELRAEVNDSCGLHVHLDMRHRDENKAIFNLTQAQSLLYAMVPENRRDNKFCKELPVLNNKAEAYAIYKHLTEREQRYYGINTKALYKYGTIECRIHSGTVEYKKIVNWVSLLIKIVDAESKEYLPVTIQELRYLWNLPKKLAEYVTERVKKFSRRSAWLNAPAPGKVPSWAAPIPIQSSINSNTSDEAIPF